MNSAVTETDIDGMHVLRHGTAGRVVPNANSRHRHALIRGAAFAVAVEVALSASLPAQGSDHDRVCPGAAVISIDVNAKHDDLLLVDGTRVVGTVVSAADTSLVVIRSTTGTLVGFSCANVAHITLRAVRQAPTIALEAPIITRQVPTGRTRYLYAGASNGAVFGGEVHRVSPTRIGVGASVSASSPHMFISGTDRVTIPDDFDRTEWFVRDQYVDRAVLTVFVSRSVSPRMQVTAGLGGSTAISYSEWVWRADPTSSGVWTKNENDRYGPAVGVHYESDVLSMHGQLIAARRPTVVLGIGFGRNGS